MFTRHTVACWRGVRRLILGVHDAPVAAYGGAFALSYAVGVVVVVAPAGVGAREAIFILLLTPLALLARVVHTAADALLAAGWSVSRSCRTRRSRGWP